MQWVRGCGQCAGFQNHLDDLRVLYTACAEMVFDEHKSIEELEEIYLTARHTRALGKKHVAMEHGIRDAR